MVGDGLGRGPLLQAGAAMPAVSPAEHAVHTEAPETAAYVSASHATQEPE